MATTEWDGATFEAHRPLLFSIAYRMLGSASEAEDVVQDAWLRARQDEDTDVRSPGRTREYMGLAPTGRFITYRATPARDRRRANPLRPVA